MQNIGFIGSGNMANAIVKGLLNNNIDANSLWVSSPNITTKLNWHNFKLNTITNNVALVEQVEIIILAIKPQKMAEICQEIAPLDLSNKLIISIAAGISIARLKQLLPSANYLVRVMPNTPVALELGVSGIYTDPITKNKYQHIVDTIFNKIGIVCWLEQEADINLIIAGAGSSPAYFFLFAQYMTEFLQKKGFDNTQARNIVQQSMLGAASMMIKNPDISLPQLRAQVTSAKGTTAQAIETFQQNNLDHIIAQAMQQAIIRAEEMEQEL